MHTPIAVILARGLGTRMRRADAGASLAEEQARVADTGLKAMIPVGRPFLDYVLSALADAGLTDVCLVIGPEHDAVREYYGGASAPARLRVAFAVQAQPLGTADAVAAAAGVVGSRDFLVLNSDNYYPVEAYRALAALDGPGLVAFERDAMIRGSNVPAERVRQFAVVRIGADESMVDIVEKPDEATLASFGAHVYLSMNCWRFDTTVLDACRRVPLSPRGERELTDAVRLARHDLGVRFRVVRMAAGVLDLSSRGDIAGVTGRLAGVEVRL
jgi:glucose-1-phosphate thymidylyltransferase